MLRTVCPICHRSGVPLLQGDSPVTRGCVNCEVTAMLIRDAQFCYPERGILEQFSSKQYGTYEPCCFSTHEELARVLGRSLGNLRKLSVWELNVKEQYLFAFPNGYGASVVRGYGTYGSSSGKFELAVLRITDLDEFSVCSSHGLAGCELDYSTSVTNDVIGYLDEVGVCKYLKQIKNLNLFVTIFHTFFSSLFTVLRTFKTRGWTRIDTP